MSNETCRNGPKVFWGQAILKKMIGGQRRLSKSIQGYWGQAMFKQKKKCWPRKPVELDPG